MTKAVRSFGRLYDNYRPGWRISANRNQISASDKKMALCAKKWPCKAVQARYHSGSPKPGVSMLLKKTFSLIAMVSLALLAACSDVTGPKPSGFCPITGGPGVCGKIASQH